MDHALWVLKGPIRSHPEIEDWKTIPRRRANHSTSTYGYVLRSSPGLIDSSWIFDIRSLRLTVSCQYRRSRNPTAFLVSTPTSLPKSKELFPTSLALDFPWLTLCLLASMMSNMESDPYPLEVHCGPDQTLFVGPLIPQLSSQRGNFVCHFHHHLAYCGGSIYVFGINFLSADLIESHTQ